MALVVVFCCFLSSPVAACDPQICFNETYAISMNKSDAVVPYQQCVNRSRGVTAFVCRCTPRIFECLQNTSLGNCEKLDARHRCWVYVTDQGLGCSQKLCKAAASGYSTALAAMLSLVVLVCMSAL